MKKILRLCLGGAIAGLLSLMPSVAPAEEVGVSREDLPNYSGAYSIENTTGVLIHYQYRWGSKQKWMTKTIASGFIDTMSYPLGEDPNKRVPTPYVRFDRTGGDNGVTWREYALDFHAVGYAGYGPKQHKTAPKRYVFRYSANGRDLDLNAK